MQTFELALPNGLSLGNGLKAVTAWLRQSPLVLVDVVDSVGEHHKARLDLNKQVFIDSLPHEPSSSGVKSVVEAVATESESERTRL
ncbi:MAG: hypothetical protein EOP71_03930 [Variovorax sp.]|nr:MAG: hypothetical protein EOP71_03930 [Variovorax sp.]